MLRGPRSRGAAHPFFFLGSSGGRGSVSVGGGGGRSLGGGGAEKPGGGGGANESGGGGGGDGRPLISTGGGGIEWPFVDPLAILAILAFKMKLDDLPTNCISDRGDRDRCSEL